VLGESFAKELRKIPVTYITVRRRVEVISEDLCDQLIHQLKTSRSGLQVDEATDVVKDAH
jgi:hypothetical protein